MTRGKKATINIILALWLIFLLFMILNETSSKEELSVVSDGSGCYSFKHGTWVAEECYDTPAKALKEGEDWLKYFEQYQNHASKNWEEVPIGK